MSSTTSATSGGNDRVSSSFFFPDNTALINFHIVNRWDLLSATMDGKGQWCGAVAAECRRWTAKQYPGMYGNADAIFGDPVYPEGAEHVNTTVLRRRMADPTDDWPTRHLGEAETITVIDSRFKSSRFITDDLEASNFAAAEDIKCYGTGDLLVVAERGLELISTADRHFLEQVLSNANRTIRYFQFAK